MTKVGIIGAGLIGRAWAHVFARGGCEVRMWDPSPQQRDAALAWMPASLAELARHGLVDDPVAAARHLSAPEASLLALLEVIFGVDPDHGSGALEVVISFGLLAVAGVSSVLASREWRRPAIP